MKTTEQLGKWLDERIVARCAVDPQTGNGHITLRTTPGRVTMAAAAPATDPILMKFRKALDEIYGPRLERVVLFGSHARGDARADSDYDVAIFLRDLTNRRAEVKRLTALQDDVMADADPYIDAIPFPAGAWAERSSFMHELRREGLDL